MINYKPEIIAFYEKYKDVSTNEEWQQLAKETGKFPDKLPLLERCLYAIEKRYKEKTACSTEAEGSHECS